MEFGQKPNWEPTYRLEPREHERFYPSKVRAIIEEIVLRNVKDKEYDHANSKPLAESIAEQIKMAVKGQNIPSYKIVV